MNKKIIKLEQVILSHQKGDLKSARVGYLKYLKKYPKHPDALHLLGLIEFQEGDVLKARKLIKQAIELEPRSAMYLANLGRVEKVGGRINEAEIAFQLALDIEPRNPEVQTDLSAISIGLGRFEKAKNLAKTALSVNPVNSNALLNFGLAELGLGLRQSALTAFRDACACNQNNAEAHFQYARMLHESGDIELAKNEYKKAIKINPKMAEAYCNLGNIHREKADFYMALESYEQAIKLKPECPEIYANQGIALHEMGRLHEAIEVYRKGLLLQPDDAETHRNLSMALLCRKNFKEGWKEFEWRWRTKKFLPFRRNWSKPQWMGQKLRGKTILVHAEQGFGDSIQFSRYLPMISNKGAQVIVECPSELNGLIAQIRGVAKTIHKREMISVYDYHVPMMSLAGLFNEKLKFSSQSPGYICIPKTNIIHWRNRIKNNSGKLKIGLVWRGNKAHPRDAWRSIDLKIFEPLINIEELNIFLLQKDVSSWESNFVEVRQNVTDLDQELKNFLDTAGIISNLDLVISPDTAIAHLSGAIGKEVWILLSKVAEWRWFEKSTSSPWYSSARLFRQTKFGDWKSVVDEVCSEIIARIEKK